MATNLASKKNVNKNSLKQSVPVLDQDFYEIFNRANKFLKKNQEIVIEETKVSLSRKAFRANYTKKDIEANLIVLYNPQNNAQWNSDFRYAVYYKIHPDKWLFEDELFSEVMWSYFSESFESCHTHKFNGTVTKLNDDSFTRNNLIQRINTLEIRASWSSDDSIEKNIEAWMKSIENCNNQI